MNLQSSVTDTAAERDAESIIGVTGKLVMFWAEHTLPMPRQMEFSADQPSIYMWFTSREALDSWFAALGPTFPDEAVGTQTVLGSEHQAAHILHTAFSRRWGWSIGLWARTPIAEPSTEEPERTLTAVERDAEPVPYDASVEDRHEHGFTFREGLGYLADDPFCDGCCELATAKWKSSWQRPTTDAETVTADVDAKTAEAGAE